MSDSRCQLLHFTGRGPNGASHVMRVLAQWGSWAQRHELPADATLAVAETLLGVTRLKLVGEACEAKIGPYVIGTHGDRKIAATINAHGRLAIDLGGEGTAVPATRTGRGAALFGLSLIEECRRVGASTMEFGQLAVMAVPMVESGMDTLRHVCAAEGVVDVLGRDATRFYIRRAPVDRIEAEVVGLVAVVAPEQPEAARRAAARSVAEGARKRIEEKRNALSGNAKANGDAKATAASKTVAYPALVTTFQAVAGWFDSRIGGRERWDGARRLADLCQSPPSTVRLTSRVVATLTADDQLDIKTAKTAGPVGPRPAARRGTALILSALDQLERLNFEQAEAAACLRGIAQLCGATAYATGDRGHSLSVVLARGVCLIKLQGDVLTIERQAEK